MNDHPSQFASATGYAMAEQFLQMLDPDAERFTFLLVNEEGHAYRKPIERHGTLAQLWPTIVDCNQMNDRYAAFVTVNETDFRGRKTENIVRVRALFVDADTPESVATIKFAAKQTGLRPSILVASKIDRAHAYWLTSDTPLEQFSFLQRALIQLFRSDAKVHDLPRVMRLPGTLHLKGEQLQVRMWPSEPLAAYKTGEIVAAFGLRELMSGRSRPRRGPAPVAHALAQSELLKDLPLESLSERADWFGKLAGDAKDEALSQMFGAIPDTACGTRGPALPGNPPEWLDCLMAAHASGAPHAEEIARTWSTLSEDKYSDAEFDKAAGSFTDRPGGITIGTLIKVASERGIDPATGKVFNADAWRAYADDAKLAAQMGTTPPAFPAPERTPGELLVGGKPLLTTLPQQTLQDLPGNKERIMEALDRRVAADPYTFQNGDRLISLRISPGAAVLFPQMVDRGASVSRPAVVDEGDMPVMLETTDADVLYLADRDHWGGPFTGPRCGRGTAKA